MEGFDINGIIEMIKGLPWEDIINTIKDTVIPFITEKIVPVITDLIGNIA